MTQAVLGLGGNLGGRQALLAAALAELAGHPEIEVEAVSALYETPPWGKTDQPPFLNAAARIETSLPARELLDEILRVERVMGRNRGEKWGPRNVDIDILLFGTEKIDMPGLRVPHPHLHERAFALRPLLDVIPDVSIRGRPAAEWLARADGGGMTVYASPGWHTSGDLSPRT